MTARCRRTRSAWLLRMSDASPTNSDLYNTALAFSILLGLLYTISLGLDVVDYRRIGSSQPEEEGLHGVVTA